MKPFKHLLLAGAFVSATLMQTTAFSQTKWDVPTSYASSIYQVKVLEKFTDNVREASGGKLNPVVHPNASLFKLNEIKRAVQTGQVQMGEMLVGLLENENKAFGADTVPFLATGFSEAYDLWLASKPVYEAYLAKQGLKLLYSIPWPPNALLTKKPIESLDELKGLKWRAYNPATSRFGELIGAQPVTVATVDLSQAVATGVVDALATASSVAVQLKLHETMSHYYLMNAWLPRNMVIVNQRAFNALDKDIQEIILSEAAEAEKLGWQMAADDEKSNLATLEENGMQVLPLSPQLKGELEEVGQTMLAEWLKIAGSDGKSIIDAYRK